MPGKDHLRGEHEQPKGHAQGNDNESYAPPSSPGESYPNQIDQEHEGHEQGVDPEDADRTAAGDDLDRRKVHPIEDGQHPRHKAKRIADHRQPAAQETPASIPGKKTFGPCAIPVIHPQDLFRHETAAVYPDGVAGAGPQEIPG